MKLLQALSYVGILANSFILLCIKASFRVCGFGFDMKQRNTLRKEQIDRERKREIYSKHSLC